MKVSLLVATGLGLLVALIFTMPVLFGGGTVANWVGIGLAVVLISMAAGFLERMVR